MSGDFLNPDLPIHKHGQRLPHWQQGEVMQFVTFRLGDALPPAKVQHWKQQSRAWKNTWPPPWTKEQEEEYHRKFTAKLERWLDQGAGSCILRIERNRLLVENVLMRFQGERVHHHAWVIMPNHLHLLFKPISPFGQTDSGMEVGVSKRHGSWVHLAAQLSGYNDPGWGSLCECREVYPAESFEGEVEAGGVYPLGERAGDGGEIDTKEMGGLLPSLSIGRDVQSPYFISSRL